MRNLKLLLLLACAVWTWGCQSGTPKSNLNWNTSWKVARDGSKMSGKPMLVFFTGSDWCIYCKKIQREVFNTAEFEKWAKDRVVLVEADFPRRKTLTEELQRQNQWLASEYAIQGYPTVILISFQGKELGRLGYAEVTAKQWINRAEQLLPARPAN